jgi:two-component system, NtrC family, sensor histidine kinase HydH
MRRKRAHRPVFRIRTEKTPRLEDAPRRGSRLRAMSLIIAIASIIALSFIAFLYFKNLDDMARLACQNDTERTFSTLWESLREHDDFGEGIESIDFLKKKVIGLGIYGPGGARIFGWGESPVNLDDSDADSALRIEGDSGRGYIEKPGSESIVLLLRPMRMNQRPPLRGQGGFGMPMERDRARLRPTFLETLRQGMLVYLDVRQESFWRGRRARIALYPVLVALFFAGVFFVRSIFIRNREYLKRIEDQENLVILGTAASTLAHEIKTPLHSIRLQTGILEKSLSGEADREIRIINEEVERLSLLSYRVNDFIREPLGNPESLDPADIAREAGLRAFGRDIVSSSHSAARVSMDPERMRSVIENLLRNAAESGSPEEAVEISISKEGSSVRIDVLDRGEGVSAENRAKLFQTFFTTKSRGSGIGLPICRRFVEGAGGKISIEARQEGGTRARIELPEAGA